jgi:hypothetical protein
MSLRDRDELELSEIFADAFAAKQDAEAAMSDVVQERAYRKDLDLAHLKLETERLNDGIDAIRRYGLDTLLGPTSNADNTRDWQRACVLEMTNRAGRVLNGKPWLKEE